jgi:hypothetical protein
MGGRTSDAAGSDLLNPAEYTPGGGWATKAAIFNDNQVNNMVGGVLTVGGTPYIFTVGGSAAGATVGTNAVRQYNPVSDLLMVVGTDPWPGNAGGNVLPGGAAVVNNKLYVFGGFVINAGTIATIYEFDPNRPAGTMWATKTATLPVPLAYLPTTAIGGLIYTAGGSTWDSINLTLNDSNNSYVYNPATDTIAPITSIPRITAETVAVTMGGQMWVLGGGRTVPNPSNEVDVYDPGTNTWSLGTPFTTARRNFPAAANGTNVFLVGGYAPSIATNTMEIYIPAVPCGPTSTPTPANILIGHVTLQGVPQPSLRNVEAITLTLCVAGSPQVYLANLDQQGFFTVTTTLPNGNYGWKTKPYKSLSNSGVLAFAGGTLNLEMGTLKGGDANNSNNVNSVDFNLLKNAFGTSNNLFTDFNNDGTTNATDFNTQKGNFGLVGTGTCP